MISKKYFKVVFPIHALILVAAFSITPTVTIAGGYPWDPLHSNPYDFWFGNHIDTHQQSQIKNNGELKGFLWFIRLKRTLSHEVP